MSNRTRSLDAALTEVLKRRLGQGGPWPREVYRHVERQARARGEAPEVWLQGVEQRVDDFTDLIAAATVGHTAFFRHPDHFDQVRKRAGSIALNTPCVRVWSAACSTGEEVWSLALSLREAGVHFQIWATDVNAKAVDIARRGIYAARATSGLPGHAGKLAWKVPADLQARVRFAVAGIAELPMADAPAVYDLIFCRNVMIYFQPEVVQSTWKIMTQRLAPWGAIAVAPVESLSHVPPELIRRGPLGWMEWRTQHARPQLSGATVTSEVISETVEDIATARSEVVLEQVARLLSAREYDAAEQALHQLLASRDDAVGWFLLGETCARRGETTQAKIAYLRATRATEVSQDVDLDTIRAASQRRAQQLG